MSLPARGCPCPQASTRGSRAARAFIEALAESKSQEAAKAVGKASGGEARPFHEFTSIVVKASPATRTLSFSRHSEMWPGECPGVSMTCHSPKMGCSSSLRGRTRDPRSNFWRGAKRIIRASGPPTVGSAGGKASRPVR
jgi:hypothetical protein